MLQRQPSSITTALPFYFTSTAMQYSRWSYKQTYSTRSLVREPLVIARYPSLTTKRESFHVIRLLVYFSMLSACQHLNRLLVAYPLVSISACQHLIRLQHLMSWLLTYLLVSNSACQHLIRFLALSILSALQCFIHSFAYPLVTILSACYCFIRSLANPFAIMQSAFQYLVLLLLTSR